MEDTNADMECCPKFDPTSWQEKTFEWSNKKFIKAKVFTFMYMPVNFGSVMTKMTGKIEKAGSKMQDGLCLSEHTSGFNMNLYLAVDKDIPGAENLTLSGKYFSKVYEGNFKDTGVWCKDFDAAVKTKSLKLEKMYMWYTTCPKCAKKYGKNYVVIIGKIG